MEVFSNPQAWIGLITLTLLEIVLGIDNIVFISILAGKLPADQQHKARQIGLFLAMFMRIMLLLSLAWIMSLTRDLFAVMGHGISGRDLILILGGLFLVAKSTMEIHHRLEGEEGEAVAKVPPSFAGVIFQILLLDLVFSLDSVITAVGMVREVSVMIAAVIIAVLFMMAFAGMVSEFINKHPTVKMLALSFLLLIGFTLLADGFGQHISKGYIYAAMGFSIFVEMLNLKIRTKREPVQLHNPYGPPA